MQEESKLELEVACERSKWQKELRECGGVEAVGGEPFIGLSTKGSCGRKNLGPGALVGDLTQDTRNILASPRVRIGSKARGTLREPFE